MIHGLKNLPFTFGPLPNLLVLQKSKLKSLHVELYAHRHQKLISLHLFIDLFHEDISSLFRIKQLILYLKHIYAVIQMALQKKLL